MSEIRTTEDGIRLYYCLKCLDQGWYIPLKTDGSNKPDYAHPVRCGCQAKIERAEISHEHPERPSRRKK